jgi:hypothetical protein
MQFTPYGNLSIPHAASPVNIVSFNDCKSRYETTKFVVIIVVILFYGRKRPYSAGLTTPVNKTHDSLVTQVKFLIIIIFYIFFHFFFLDCEDIEIQSRRFVFSHSAIVYYE